MMIGIVVWLIAGNLINSWTTTAMTMIIVIIESGTTRNVTSLPTNELRRRKKRDTFAL